MGQEFIIKSQNLEDKVNQLLPSQGGFQAGVDLSASTTIIPIVDLTESAEGSNIRADLQTALSLNSCSTFQAQNSTATIINTTGTFRIFGTVSMTSGNSVIRITDGTTTKTLRSFGSLPTGNIEQQFDFNVFLQAGDSVEAVTNSNNAFIAGVTRQIADLSGNLVNP